METDTVHVYAETPRLVLRSWKPDDLEVFASLNADSEVMRHFPAPLSFEETKSFYDRIQDEFRRVGYGLYAVELKSTGRFIGYVGLHAFNFDVPFAPGVEIGWRLAARYHRQGYAPEAATAVLSVAKSLGLRKLFSFTALANTPSERVMQKIGMRRTDEFDHPALADGHPLKRHVLYTIDL